MCAFLYGLRVTHDGSQAMDESRAEQLVQTLNRVATCYRDATGGADVFAGLTSTVQGHSKSLDSAAFARSQKSGAPLPGDLPVHEGKVPGSKASTKRPPEDTGSSAVADRDDAEEGTESQEPVSGLVVS